MSDQKPGPGAPPNENDDRPWKSPVVIIAVSILWSIFALVLFAILDWDRGGVLKRMSEVGFARGLITYLFAVATMGTAIVLTVYALTSAKGGNDARFENGKEILSLLLGVFGTIVGFYFGREGTLPTEAALALAPLKLSATQVSAGQTFRVTTVAFGGKAPIRYAIVFGEEKPDFGDAAASVAYSGGWIEKEVVAPAKPGQAIVRVAVQDADRHESEQTATVTVAAAQK